VCLWWAHVIMLGNTGPGSRASAAGPFMVVDTSPDGEAHMVQPGLFIGSQDAATDMAELQKHGITSIVNVAYGIQNQFEDVS
jgi:hypothetical protein